MPNAHKKGQMEPFDVHFLGLDDHPDMVGLLFKIGPIRLHSMRLMLRRWYRRFFAVRSSNPDDMSNPHRGGYHQIRSSKNAKSLDNQNNLATVIMSLG